MVGTPKNMVSPPPRRARSGVKRSTTTAEAPAARVPKRPAPGRAHGAAGGQGSSRRWPGQPQASRIACTPASSDPWVWTAPLGRPVVPEVKTMNASSSGRAVSRSGRYADSIGDSDGVTVRQFRRGRASPVTARRSGEWRPTGGRPRQRRRAGRGDGRVDRHDHGRGSRAPTSHTIKAGEGSPPHRTRSCAATPDAARAPAAAAVLSSSMPPVRPGDSGEPVAQHDLRRLTFPVRRPDPGQGPACREVVHDGGPKEMAVPRGDRLGCAPIVWRA